MGQAQDHALGRSRRAFAKAEASFGTQIALAATDALKTTKPFKFDAKIDRRNRVDNRNTRDVLERISGLTTVKWDVESYLLPSGSAGTKPNIGTLLKLALGTETVNGGVSVVYGLNNLQSMGSATIEQYFNANPAGIFMETAIGAFVDEMQLKVSGKDEPRLTFTGQAKAYAHTGTSTSVGIVAGAATTFTLTDPTALQAGSVFAGGADNNSGAGYTATSVSAAGVVVFAPPAVTGWAASAAITPFTPSETTVGNPVSFTLGSMTLDAVGIPVVDFELHVKNNHKVLMDEAFNVGISDYLPGNRDVTGKFTVRARKDQILNWGKRWSLATRAIIVNVGTIAGKKLAASLPTVEIEFNPANIPADEDVLFDFPFTALGASGEDSATLTFT